MLERDEEREEFLEQNREPSEDALGEDELIDPAIGEGLVENLAEELEEESSASTMRASISTCWRCGFADMSNIPLSLPATNAPREGRMGTLPRTYTVLPIFSVCRFFARTITSNASCHAAFFKFRVIVPPTDSSVTILTPAVSPKSCSSARTGIS